MTYNSYICRMRRRFLITLICNFIIGILIGMFIGRILFVKAYSEPPVVEQKVARGTEISPEIIYVGECKISAYCKENYPHICNDGDSTYTATMTTPTVGRTIAVDPNVIPYGSEVNINGKSYVAEDTGGAIKGNRVDILFETHQEALNFGIQHTDVSYIAKESN